MVNATLAGRGLPVDPISARLQHSHGWWWGWTMVDVTRVCRYGRFDG